MQQTGGKHRGRYLADLDGGTGTVGGDRVKVAHLKEKVATVKAQMRRLKQIGKQMSNAPDGQISRRSGCALEDTSGEALALSATTCRTAVDAKTT